MDRAWTNDDEETIVLASNDISDLLTGRGDGQRRLWGHRDLFDENRWRE
jgi:hypothetical protein